MNELIVVSNEKITEVLEEIDALIKYNETAANKSVARMSRLLLEVKEGAYWTNRGFKNEDEYIKTLPYSRAQYYNLIGIALHLGHLSEETLVNLGTKKAEALVRISKHNPSLTDEWLGKAQTMMHKDFLAEVKTFFKKKDDVSDEEFEIVKFKLTKEQNNIVTESLKIASLMLGSDKSQGHQLEVICADFLASQNDDGSGRVENRNSFIIDVIKRMAKQLDTNALQALVGAMASIVEGSNGE